MTEHFRYHSVNVTVSDSFEALTLWLEKTEFTSYIILTDTNCKKHAVPLLKRLHSRFKKAEVLVMKAGEKNKNLKTAEKLLSALMKMNADRKTLIINVGGGVVCDMGAFVASIYRRGIAFMHIPTTLLSMADAAIGSKNGIDFYGIKNSVGTFSHPAYIFINPIFLLSLPFDELMNGVAESFKHGLCDSPAHLGLVINDLERLHLPHIILHSVAYKVEIVNEDLYDTSKRRVLNLGHTTGHAIEALLLDSGFDVKHGMCVFYGLVVALLLSVEECGFTESEAFAYIEKIKRYCPILPLKKIDAKSILKLMRYDKKNVSGNIRMVLLKKVGEPIWDMEVNVRKIERAIRQAIEIMSA